MPSDILLSSLPEIAAGIDHLTSIDDDFLRVAQTEDPLRYVRRPAGFPGLVRIILGQQVSTVAAESIWQKLHTTLDMMTPEACLSVEEDALRQCGLSGQKVRYVRGIATEIVEGRLDLDALAHQDDQTCIDRLTQCLGVGRWTVENYLLFCLGRPDIFPANDLGIIVGLGWLKKLETRPSASEAFLISEAWRPYRSAASLILWHYYTAELVRRRGTSPRKQR